MEQFITRIRTNLNGVLEMTQMFDGLMMTGDNLANRIVVELNRDGTPIRISDEWDITGYIIRNDGYTLDIEGGITEEGHAYIDLPDLAYEVSGPLSIAVRMSSGTQKVAIATASCYVNMTRTDAIIDPTHRIPDVEELLAYIDEVEAERDAVRAEEAIRAQSETARVAAETTRIGAENTRIQNESNRSNAETSRVLAEQGRVSAESARVTAEQGRASAEASRETAEAARESATSAAVLKIDGMTVEAERLPDYSDPTVAITEISGHKHIKFGIAPGDPFRIQRTFASIAEMNAYTGTDIRVGQFVIIDTGNVEDPDNAKLFLKITEGFSYITDLSGSQGIQGPQGVTGNGIASVELTNDYKLKVNYTNGTSDTTSNPIRGEKGETGDTGATGPTGATGNGIASVVQNADYTMTITMTDGTSYTTGSIKGDQGEPGISNFNLSYDSTNNALALELS